MAKGEELPGIDGRRRYLWPRSMAARAPENGAWPCEMRADTAAAFLDYATTGEFYQAIIRGEAPRPTGSRYRAGRREPLWSLDACRMDVARRHDIARDGSADAENIGSLI
jgi:hypothetical protein